MTMPPERCPVCDMIYDWRDTDDKGQLERVTYNCGARWQVYTNGAQGWTDECPHAMTAALRCGATLRPTPLELARAALVEAAVAYAETKHAYEKGADYESLLYSKRDLLVKTDAYRAALERHT